MLHLAINTRKLHKIHISFLLSFKNILTFYFDQKKAIEDTHLTEMQALPEVVRDFKKQAMRQYLQQLEDDLTHPETFEPQRSLTAKLNEIEHGDDSSLKSYAARLKTQVIGMVTRDIDRKYDRNTPVEILTDTEMHILRWLKPLAKGEPSYGPTVVKLYWDINERDIDQNLRNLSEDPDCEIHFPISKLRFLASSPQVTGNVRDKAHSLLEKLEIATVNRIERKYPIQTQVSELTDIERMVLSKLKLTSKTYGPVVKSLHWKVTYDGLCKDLQEYKQGQLQVTDGFIGRIGFLANNQSVPSDVKGKAREFQKLLPRRQGRRR